MASRARIPAAERIIEKVKERPQLWSSSSPAYRMKFGKIKIWRQIGHELGFSEFEVRKKWKNLKDQYRKELKKNMADETYEPCWRYYADMEFLKDELITQTSIPKASEGMTDTEPPSDEEEDEAPKKKKKKNKAPLPPEEEKQFEESSSSNYIPTIRMETKKLNTVIRKLDYIKDTIETKLSHEQEVKNDPEYQFLMSLLPSVQKLPEIQRIQFRSRVYEFLLEALTQNEYHNPLDTKIYLQTQGDDG